MSEIYIAPNYLEDNVMYDVYMQTKADAVISDDGTTVQSHVSDGNKHILSCLHTKVGTSHRLSDGNTGAISGSNVTINDAADTNADSFTINGLTTVVGTGNKSPDNPYSINGLSSVVITVNQNTYTVTIAKPLYNLGTNVKDFVDIVSGTRINNIAELKFVGTENWSIYSTSVNATSACFYINTFTNRLVSNAGMCDKFIYNSNLLDVSVTDEGYWLSDSLPSANVGYIRINKTRLIGWSDSLSDNAKVNLFKTWLTTNNLKFIYNLSSPTYENVTPTDIIINSGNCTVSIDKSTFTLNYYKEVPNLNIIDFIATADFNSGDTFRINGSLLSAKMSNGNVLYNNIFKSGGNIIGKVNGSNLLISASDGGDANTVNGKRATDFVPKVTGATGSCDTYFQTGFYSGVFTSYPSALPDGQGTLIITSYNATSNAGYTQQEFVSAQTSIRYIRRANNGAWEAWKVQYSADNISQASVANANTVGGLSAADLGGMVVGTTPPTQTTKGWIDTGNGGILKYYNGSAWVAAKSVWG